MAFTDMDESNDEIGEQPPEGDEGGSNRTFIIIAAVLGGITLLALLCTAIYAFVYLPRTRADRQNAAATAYAQETMLAYESTQAALPPTATNTKQPEAVKATPTPVLAEEEAVNTATPTINSVQATQDALIRLLLPTDPKSHRYEIANQRFCRRRRAPVPGDGCHPGGGDLPGAPAAHILRFLA
jgi:hypothetical protein